jgi:hypothetical protein
METSRTFKKGKLVIQLDDLIQSYNLANVNSIIASINHNSTEAWDEGVLGGLSVNGEQKVKIPATQPTFSETIDITPFLSSGNNRIGFGVIAFNFNRWQSSASITLVVDGRITVNKNYPVPHETYKAYVDHWEFNV